MRKTIKNLVAIVTVVTAFFGLSVLFLIFLGYRPFIITTQSMEPMFMQGSLCWVDTRVTLDSLEIGDAIVYRSPANSLVLHRLVGIQESDTPSSLSVVMQGDANELTQNVELSHINYVGREAFTIPRLGTAVDKLISSQGIWFVVAFLLILSCIPWGND